MSEEKRLSQESGKEDTLKQNEKEMYIREIHAALEKADGRNLLLAYRFILSLIK